jgi:hypothetical protein
MTEQKKSRFQKVCPRQLDAPPCDACPLALEAINSLRADAADKKRKDTEVHAGCPWFVTSAEHGYCFWSYAQSIDKDSVSDKEIGDLLLLSQPTVERVFNSAVEKLQAIKDSDSIRALQEAVALSLEHQAVDYTMYMPEEFRDAIKEAGEAEASSILEAEEDQPSKRRKPSHGLPIHRDGRKVDLFGLYSRRALEKKKAKAKKDDKEN